MDPEKQNKKSERLKLHFAQTAHDMILRDGMDGLSVRKIAREAGYTYATIYNHFGCLDELLWHSRSLFIEDIARHMAPAESQKINSLDELTGIFRLYAEYFLAHGDVFRFLYCYPLDKEAKRIAGRNESDQFRRQFMETFQFLIGTGQYTFEEIGSLSRTLLYTIHGYLTMALTENDNLQSSQVAEGIGTAVKQLFSRAV